MRDFKRFKFSKKQVGLPPFKLGIGMDAPIFSKLIDSMYYPITIMLQEILGFGFPKNRVTRFKEHLIPLEDGSRLATDVYLPNAVYKKYLEKKISTSKCPTILVRLPYFKDSVSIIGYSLASRGYAAIIQDIRGCARSSPYGTNTIMLGDRPDGFETLKWITKRFWYNGKIGMWGASYFGQTQLAVSWDTHNLITCLNPGLCSYSNMVYHEGGLNCNELLAGFLDILYGISNSTRTVSDTSKISKKGAEYVDLMFRCPYDRLYNDPLDIMDSRISMGDLKGKGFEEITKLLNQKFDLSLNFSKKDDGSFNKFIEQAIYQRKLDLQSELMPSNLNLDWAQLDTPMLLIAGWYDLFLEKILKDFIDIQKLTPKEAQKNIKLIIGPWGHANKGHADLSMLGGMLGLVKELFPIKWFDYWLKGKDSDWATQPAIWYYVLCKNIWRYTNEWPLTNTNYTNYYIHSEGKANSKFGNGKLSLEEPKHEVHDSYKFHPLNPVLTKGGRNLTVAIGGQDQNESESRKDVLVYTSDILKNGIQITGPIKMVLYASSSAIDTDFMVKLVDVYPNGKAFNIIDDGIRARFRDSLSSPSLIEPDRIYKYTINLGNTCIYFRKDHRIRVDITSSNFPKYDINSNLGGKQNEKGFKIAFQKIYHNSDNQSHIILPIIPEK
ncbi:MAG: CocE/NonD family hydrolase [Promethearchaeota archaeon]